MALKKFCYEVLFIIIINVYYRPHWRNHHGGQRKRGRLPPWTSPASRQPALHATSREQQEAAAELLAVLSAGAGCERHRMSGEWDQLKDDWVCSRSVMRLCQCSHSCCFGLSGVWAVSYTSWNERWQQPEGEHVGVCFRCGLGWGGGLVLCDWCRSRPRQTQRKFNYVW